MPIIDDAELLARHELDRFHDILMTHKVHPDHFLLEISEDQTAVDMNDINYVVIIKATATHLPHQKSKTYTSRANTGTWLAEFEEDLKKGFFDYAD